MTGCLYPLNRRSIRVIENASGEKKMAMKEWIYCMKTIWAREVNYFGLCLEFTFKIIFFWTSNIFSYFPDLNCILRFLGTYVPQNFVEVQRLNWFCSISFVFCLFWKPDHWGSHISNPWNLDCLIERRADRMVCNVLSEGHWIRQFVIIGLLIVDKADYEIKKKNL